ncbi:hypothetical protein [Mesorhizobium sp.]|uniref:hypothetical protein n=1 Tax=Mesorhizobium sp. TaxID=1871066 RepID=UPI000FE328BF|nr:hypothetical protein [Mesorhizobium sp.]RWH65943.1 MAG: hypothetical protein EOQ84_32035 [Mesorhizobium sp.]RWL20151.1 MAG: hypothetical protein EOR58_31625 [Mesorhizobium sp.]RWL23583.1 MAG: hypothetical protein EOR63_31815 [Mesorhizobium sp.]RWL27678.1 MAG: hypothetical protein EOR59_31850 [Mesorhizobium sp.]RWL46027.1 MAG: hypothetical protein EOR62_30040 [Mesorhizobium sp.]
MTELKSAFALLAALAILVSGCNSANVRSGVSFSPNEMRGYANACAVPPQRLSPIGYVSAGIDLVDSKCDEFFDSLVRLQNDASFAQSGIATANTQTAAILGALKSSAATIAIIASASQLATSLIDGYTKAYAFAPYAVEVRRLVVETMQKYRSSEEFAGAVSALATLPTSSDAFCAAQNIVRNYAKACTITGIEDLMRQAISSGEIVKRKHEARPTASSKAFLLDRPGVKVLQVPGFDVM